MESKTVRLDVPAEPQFARSVRMMAASLAVTCDMSVEDVEDVRMAAEEGFVYAASTQPQQVCVAFTLGQGVMGMDFSLGEGSEDASAPEPFDLSLAELLLSALADDCHVTDDGSLLAIVMRSDGDNA